jgi:hypothetical protein
VTQEATPPSDIALSWCPGCGQMGILVHAIESFRTRNECARCHRGVVVQVALYKFDRLAAELSGFQLTAGDRAPGGGGVQSQQRSKSVERREAAQREAQPKLEAPKDPFPCSVCGLHHGCCSKCGMPLGSIQHASMPCLCGAPSPPLEASK